MRSAHPGRDHRRASLDGLGAAFGSLAGAGDRAGDRPARGPAHARRRPTRRSPKKLGVSEEELDDALLEISRSSIAALDELWSSPTGSGDAVALVDTIEDPNAVEPGGEIEETEVQELIGEAIAALPEREKLVITLYYYEELTLREIGEVLGVTESRVSQLHTKAILRLKARLAGAQSRTVRVRRRIADGPPVRNLPGLQAVNGRAVATTRATLLGHRGHEEEPAVHARVRAPSATSPSSVTAGPARRHWSRRCCSRRARRTGSGRSSRARRSPTGTRTSTSGRCRCRRRSATSSGRASKINLIDAPGDAGFQADTIAVARVVEGARRGRERGRRRRGADRARVGALRRARRLARRLRQHARPRAGGLRRRARADSLAALRPLRRRADPDRPRARAAAASSTSSTCART